jgi:hypothetical protein
VTEFAAAELGVVLGVTTMAAQSLLRDVLDLRHRHPLLWAAVLAGRARFWQARQVTRATHAAGLDRDGARWVDARTAPHLGRYPWGRILGLVEAAVIEADPQRAEERRLEKAMERFVRTGRSTEHGTATIYARVEAGDAIGFRAMCDRIAQILADLGDDAPVEVLRAKAIGWLRTPLRAAALLKHAEDRAHARAADAPDEPDVPDVPDVPNAPDVPEEPDVRTEPSVPDVQGAPAASEDPFGGAAVTAVRRDDHGLHPTDLHPADDDSDDAAHDAEVCRVATGCGYVRELVIRPGVNLDAFLPTATSYVHMSLEQFHRHQLGAARVEGLGPVTLEHAADLLHHSRVTITPVVDLHQHHAVDGYQTPPRIREHVQLVHPVEVFPSGTLPSRKGDADHVIRYEHGSAERAGPPGQTSTTNIAFLGRTHHRVKTHGRGWVHRQPLPGTHYWRTPHGHWARVDHHGTHTLGRHLPVTDATLLDDDHPSAMEQVLAGLILSD